MRPQFLGILLDLDETLYSREEAFWGWLEVESRAAPHASLDRERVAGLDQRGRGDKHALLEYLDSAFDWRQQPQQRLERFRSGIGATARLAPGVEQSLIRIAGQYRLGLISNGTGATQRAKLRALRVEELFNPVVISEEVGFRKPHLEIFELALAAWGLSPESVLFVGDDPIADIQGARNAGLHVLQVGHQDGIPSIAALEAWLLARSSARE